MAAVVAAEFFDGIREIQVGARVGAYADSRRIREATVRASQGFVQRLIGGLPAESFVTLCSDRVDYEIRRAANECVAYNARRDKMKPRWARVPTGVETCDFCIMLASRGFVYHSEETASHAHPHCDCRVVPSWDKANASAEGYDPDLYYDMWRHPEDYTPNRNFNNVRYGEYRGLSYIDDELAAHRGDGSELDPVQMVMNDTDFSKDRAEQTIDDMHQWTGEGYTKIRRREGRYNEIADRIERFIAESPKYEGTVYRGIGVERNVSEDIIANLRAGREIDQLGISSWATDP